MSAETGGRRLPHADIRSESVFFKYGAELSFSFYAENYWNVRKNERRWKYYESSLGKGEKFTGRGQAEVESRRCMVD